MLKSQTINNKPLFKKDGIKYYLGLDLGITSVGWAVMAEEIKTGKHYLHDFGVRIFDKPETKKETKVSERGGFRRKRRMIRRRRYRIEKIEKILKEINLMEGEENENSSQNWKHTNKIIKEKNDIFLTENGYWNPFVARNKGLSKKLSKKEIHYVILHFCKKRGYEDKTLLLGEESENKKGLKKEFYNIWVKDPDLKDKINLQFIIDKDKKKWDKWKEEFKNDFFQKSITKVDKIIKKYKFVSTSILKESCFWLDEKPTKNYILINPKNNEKKTEKEKENKKIKGINYRFLFSRQHYKTELKQILKTQSNYYPEELNKKNIEKIEQTVFQQRNFEFGAKCKSHNNPSNKCNKKSCSRYPTFSETIGNCWYFPEEKRGYKSSLIFSSYYFVIEIMKFLSHLEEKKIKLNINERFDLIKNYIEKDWGKREIKKYIKGTDSWKKKGLDKYFEASVWKEEKDKISGMSFSENDFLKRTRETVLFKNWVQNLTLQNIIKKINKNTINKIGYILGQNRTRSIREEKIQKLINKEKIHLSNKDLKIFKYLTVNPAQVSFKHMNEIISKFLKGENPLEIIHLKKTEEIKINKKSKTKKIFEKIVDSDLEKNATVFRAINQTRKVLKTLHSFYGEFKNITLETSKEIKKSLTERKKETTQNMDKRKRKKEIILQLKEKNCPNINENKITKYKLWKQQEEKCLYCGNKLDFQKTFIDNFEVEIDHIIPRSKLTINNFDNKVLACRLCNKEKKDQTPLQFLQNNPQKKQNFEIRIDNLKQELGEKKYQFLNILNPENNRDLEEAVTRSLRNTEYINKWVLSYLNQQLGNKTTVLSVNGRITSDLRKNWLSKSVWGLNKKMIRRLTPFHHAVDAMIICQFKGLWAVELATDLFRIKRDKNKLQYLEKKEYKTKEKIEAEKDLKNFLKSTKQKWYNRSKINDYKNYGPLIQSAYEGITKNPNYSENTINSIYIKDLKEQIENRIPVKLGYSNCPDCNKNNVDENLKIRNWFCLNCYGDKKIIQIKEMFNQEEWEKNITKTNLDKNKINLRYPLVSYMVNFKIKGKWAASEQSGFILGGVKNATKIAKLKQKLYKIWKKDKTLQQNESKISINLIKKQIIKLKNKDNTEKWINDFDNKQSFIIKEKTGEVISTDKYYGFKIPKNKKEKIEALKRIKIINLIKNKSELKLKLKKSELLVGGVNVKYFDQKTNKFLIKRYKAKHGERIYIHSNQLSPNIGFCVNCQVYTPYEHSKLSPNVDELPCFYPYKSYKQTNQSSINVDNDKKKMKDKRNKSENPKNIRKKKFQILSIDTLGNFKTIKKN